MKVTIYKCDWCLTEIEPIGEGLGRPQDTLHFCSNECKEEFWLREYSIKEERQKFEKTLEKLKT